MALAPISSFYFTVSFKTQCVCRFVLHKSTILRCYSQDTAYADKIMWWWVQGERLIPSSPFKWMTHQTGWKCGFARVVNLKFCDHCFLQANPLFVHISLYTSFVTTELLLVKANGYGHWYCLFVQNTFQWTGQILHVLLTNKEREKGTVQCSLPGYACRTEAWFTMSSTPGWHINHLHWIGRQF